MTEARFFCASQSRANLESIYGTVARIRSWLLLEYPRAWRHRAIEDSRLIPDAVKQHIQTLERRGAIDRSLLIRRDHKRTGPLNCFFIRSCGARPRIDRVVLSDYEDLADAQPHGEPLNELMFAVCTHGRHDKCCAKFGFPVYCALRNLVGEQAWECSHVGGDRFAGNIVVFPYGIYYGRVLPEQVPEIVRLSERGEVWLPGYRGRSCFPRAVQVAEYFARSESGRLAIDEFSPIEPPETEGGQTRVRLQGRSDGTIHVVEFRTTTSELAQRLTCNSTEVSSVPQHELRSYSVTAGERGGHS